MLILGKEAEEDIRLAYQWYEDRRTGLGAQFLEAVDSTFRRIEKHPNLYMKVLGDVRRSLCKKFPYAVYFVQGSSDIVVIAVLHQRRTPQVLQERTKPGRGM